MFTIVPPHIWVLTDAVNDARREALLSTPYEAIVAEIEARGIPGRPKAEPNETTQYLITHRGLWSAIASRSDCLHTL